MEFCCVLGRILAMKIARRFTKPGQDALGSVEYENRTSRITNPDGSVVFEMNDA
jgi:ribonucleoside-diphosphate reductase alpha chain